MSDSRFQHNRPQVGPARGIVSPAIWTVERAQSARFPFRISVEQDGRLLLAVRAKSAWPGPGQQIFCVRERSLDPAESLEPVERVPVLTLTRVGRKLSLVLDRAQRKRCELLTVTKPRRGGDSEYEQIFFRTESGIRAHRSRSKLELGNATVRLEVIVDSAERYPWRFPGALVVRRRLPVGDYGLEREGRLIAVVERKSYDNLLSDLGAIQALHHQLADLAGYDSSALVVEAQYGDFLSERRLAGRWPASYVARALAELGAMHPRLPIVYAGNRKLANLWAERFFAACGARQAAPQLELVRETLARYDPTARTGDLDSRVRRAALGELGASFGLADLVARFTDVAPARLRRALHQLRLEGRLERVGAGRGARWEVPDVPARPQA